jgi:hypothetical protein
VVLWQLFAANGTSYFLLSAKRDAEAAKRFFRRVLAQPHTVNPRTITVDKNAAYPKATAEMKKAGELWCWSRLRQVRYLNNIVGQDHSNVKRLTCPGLGFGNFWTVRRTLAGYEAMDDQEGAGSEHWWSRHQGPGEVHRHAVQGRRLMGELVSLADASRPRQNVAIEPKYLNAGDTMPSCGKPTWPIAGADALHDLGVCRLSEVLALIKAKVMRP